MSKYRRVHTLGDSNRVGLRRVVGTGVFEYLDAFFLGLLQKLLAQGRVLNLGALRVSVEDAQGREDCRERACETCKRHHAGVDGSIFWGRETVGFSHAFRHLHAPSLRFVKVRFGVRAPVVLLLDLPNVLLEEVIGEVGSRASSVVVQAIRGKRIRQV